MLGWIVACSTKKCTPLTVDLVIGGLMYLGSSYSNLFEMVLKNSFL